MKESKKLIGYVIGVIAVLLAGIAVYPVVTDEVEEQPAKVETTAEVLEQNTVSKGECYDDKEMVALYLSLYHELPDNYITKKEAKALGWSGGGLDSYQDGACIGGDYFGNYEEMLPKEKGRKYYECDIDTMHKKSRGAKRIVYSSDGYIYYTEDHYESFTMLEHVDATLLGGE